MPPYQPPSTVRTRVRLCNISALKCELMVGITNMMVTNPLRMVSGKPTEKMFICGAARVMTPSATYTSSNSAMTGMARSAAPTNI